MKRLKRSNKDSIIAGVCGGLADYLEIDPFIIRGIWVIALFFFGTGFLAYLIAWLLIPKQENQIKANSQEDDVYEAEIIDDSSSSTHKTEPAILVGFVLIAIGSWFLMKRIPMLSDFYWWIKDNLSNYFWPIAMILAGFFLIITQNKKNN